MAVFFYFQKYSLVNAHQRVDDSLSKAALVTLFILIIQADYAHPSAHGPRRNTWV